MASGVPIPIGDNLYALVKDGKEFFRGTKKEVDELVKKLDELSDVDAKKYLDEVIDESTGLLKKLVKKFKNIEYNILVYQDRIIWKVNNHKELETWINEAKFFGQQLEFDFNTFDIKGLGKQWVDEAFNIFNNRVKTVKAEWTTNSKYPGGESLGLKQFWKEMDINYNDIKAVKKTRFYETMKSKGFKNVKSVLIYDYERVIVILGK